MHTAVSNFTVRSTTVLTTTKGSNMCSGAGRDHERFGAAGPGAPRASWGPSGSYRSGYEGWGYIPTAHQRTTSAARPGPQGGPPHRGRPGPFVGPAIVMAFLMAASLAMASPRGTSLAPLLIFPIIAALMITHRHRPRSHQLRGTRSYREAVPAPWNRPDDRFDERNSQRTVTTGPTKSRRHGRHLPPRSDHRSTRRPSGTRSRRRCSSCPRAGTRTPHRPGIRWAWHRSPGTSRSRRRPHCPGNGGAGVRPSSPGSPPALPCWCARRPSSATSPGWWPLSTVIAASWAVIALVVGLLIGSHRSRSHADR